MEKTKKIYVIILGLMVAIIIAGIIITLIKGFNFELKMQETKRIELYLEKQFENNDIKQIAKEVLGNQQVIIQKVEEFEDSVSITAKDITEEQKSEIINKVNEKYEIELDSDSIEIKTIPHTKLSDFIKPYIMPFVIATVISIIYMMIYYRKIGILRVLVDSIVIIVVFQALLFSVMAITRIPIGMFTIPLVIIVYILALIRLTTKFDIHLEVAKKKE